MEPLIVRFEQKRGHYMIIERDPPLTGKELNGVQLQMLKQCDIPGLLPMETVEYDGQISLRYALSGTRMMSEVMRTANWSMADMMGALCRLAEVLEECRYYLLDADRIRLLDEYIFVGEDWQDLKLTYLPIDMPTLHRADDLERLIIRWMMKVKEPDGRTLQNVLRLVATDGFIPIVLSRYARQYLAGTAGTSHVMPSRSEVPSVTSSHPISKKPLPPSTLTATKTSRSWDFLQPVSGDLHPVSEMWGDDLSPKLSNIPSNEVRALEPGPEYEFMDRSRWRIVVACVSLFLVAVIWRFLYLNEPSNQKLIVCLCVTLFIGAGALVLWNGLPVWLNKSRKTSSHYPTEREIDESFKSIRNDHDDIEERQGGMARFPSFYEQTISDHREYLPEINSQELSGVNSHHAETSWLSSPNDQTAYLDPQQVLKNEAYCLVWRTKDNGYGIPLHGNSLVIGRSAEAAQHVDETTGISRAHIELVRVAEQWKVKDLGSRNGSRLNDKPMAPYELYALQTGDCLTLANSQYQFQHTKS